MTACSIDLKSRSKVFTDLYYLSNNMMAFFDAIIELFGDNQTSLCEMFKNTDIDVARSEWLDRIGNMVGLPRPTTKVVGGSVFFWDFNPWDQQPWGTTLDKTTEGIDDDFYRKMIKLKAMSLITSNTVPEIRRKLQLVFGRASVRDNQDMSLTYVLGGVTQEQINLLLRYNLIPKPNSVGIKFILSDGMTWDMDSWDSNAWSNAFNVNTEITS